MATTAAMLPDIAEIRRAAAAVYAVMPPTPQYCWPQLSDLLGCEVWVKHENHTPVGAFKIRGGIVYFDKLRAREGLRGVVCATRGNHGQSVAFNAARIGTPATIVVPFGNSTEKNAAMRALGAEVVEHGDDFQAALDRARALAAERSLHLVPPFDGDLVAGVATYALEFFEGAPPLDVVYAPVGMGSGLAGAIAARNGLALETEVVAVVADGAPAYALSIAAGRVIQAPADTIADGMACRTPDATAVGAFVAQNIRCVRVTDAEIEDAMRSYFTRTHNVAEGAGAASLAAALKDAPSTRRRVGVILSGGNVDRDSYARVLSRT